MAIQYLHKDSDDSEMKPLLRTWVRDQVKLKIDPYNIPHVITLLKESKSGEWVVAETEFFSCLIHCESQLGQDLLKLIYELDGNGVGIVIIPEKKGKLGFSIGLDDEIDCYYQFKKSAGTDKGYLDCSLFKHCNDDTPRMLEAKNILKSKLSDTVSVDKQESPKNSRASKKAETNGKAPTKT